MRADNSAHVIATAWRRSAATRRRVAAALRRLDASGRPISFEALAREAQVSRSWLYAQPELRAEVERLRDQRRPGAQQRIPGRQRATEASLLSRLELATERFPELKADNRQLRDALAEARQPATARYRRAATAPGRPQGYAPAPYPPLGSC